MKLATNIKEIKKNFRHNQRFLPAEDENVYEDSLFGEQMRKLSQNIEDSDINYDTFYITGQSGNGKSTALNHLKNTNNYIKDNFEVKYLMASDVFDYSDKITIVDVLLMIGLELIQDNPKLEKVYLKKLNDLKDIATKKAEKSSISISTDERNTRKSLGVGVDVGFLEYFKFNSSIKKDWNDSEQTRNEIRKLFKLDRKELLDLINDIIKEHNSNIDNKKLLLIVDDLEKKNVSDEVFTMHKELLENIRVMKIITIPVNYAVSGKVYKLNLRIKENPLTSNEDKETINKNKEIFKKIIYNRIDEKYHHLLPDSDDVIGKLIEYSGCNIRQLLRLVNEASSNARFNESKEIGKLDVDYAIQDMVNTLSIGVVDRISFLKYIDENHTPPEDKKDKFQESIKDNSIFAYFNGIPWYEVNPILKDYIKKIK